MSSCAGALSASYAGIVSPFSGGRQEESPNTAKGQEGHPEERPSCDYWSVGNGEHRLPSATFLTRLWAEGFGLPTARFA